MDNVLETIFLLIFLATRPFGQRKGTTTLIAPPMAPCQSSWVVVLGC